MTTKKNNWNLAEMQASLVRDTEQRISDGFQEIANRQVAASVPSGSHARGESVAVSQQPSSVSHQPSEQEPTKGVQTYIPMSMYRRLNDQKLTRGENIASLVAQAIELWLDVQESKQ